MIANFQIRRATKEDAAEIGRVHVVATRAAYHGIYTDTYLDSLCAKERAFKWVEEGKGHLTLDDPDIAVFVAISNGRIIGFSDVGSAGDSALPNVAELYAIYLDSAYVGKGVGKALFLACVKHACNRGFTSMRATVLTKNSSARAFYERLYARVLPETESSMETGGTTETVITYQWADIQKLFP